ncbi:MAG: hypothetical protein QW279_06385, partial [Candidatus Jordarchaeaceae archaeon]
NKEVFVTKINSDGTFQGEYNNEKITFSISDIAPSKELTTSEPEKVIQKSGITKAAINRMVAAGVFNNKDKLFSNPLLFYQDEYPINDYIEKSLNAREGIDYFMEDWMVLATARIDWRFIHFS